ncbi:MAG: DUF4097 family beta strand repeat-containing protein [Acidobacteriota bacterium]
MQPSSPLRILIACTLILSAAGELRAAGMKKAATERIVQSFPMEANGGLVVANPIGSVEVVGTSGNSLEVDALWTVRAIDDKALADGKRLSRPQLGGTPGLRSLRSLYEPGRDRRWSAAVTYRLRVPRTVDVEITSHSGDSLQVTNVSGNVVVKNVNGNITLSSVIGTMRVESINGDITVNYPVTPTVNARFGTVNGDIRVVTPRNSQLVWHAETLNGDFLTTLPVRGGFQRQDNGTVFQGSLNGAPSPFIVTSTMTGRAWLLSDTTQVAAARSVLPREEQPGGPIGPTPETQQALRRVSSTLLVQPPTASSFVAQQNLFNGDFKFATTVGNIFVAEVTGDADIMTRAGEIVLGRVLGTCSVASMGGPLNLGDIVGPLTARTAAGDIHVRAARRGGLVSTEGGNVQVIVAGGPIRLYSGGGDIVLRQASGPVLQAETKSGDIFITIDPKLRSNPVAAVSIGGNIVLTIPPGFRADLELIVDTLGPEMNRIHTDFGGMSVTREQIGPKTRIRAVGKLNGGGDRIQLTVDEGDIQIRTLNVPSIVLPAVN